MKKLLPLLSIFFINLVSSAEGIDLVGQTKGLFSKFSFGSMWNIAGYGILIVVVIGIVAFFFQQHLMKKKFNKTVTFWRINPLTKLTIPDKTIKAMTIRLDNVGNLGFRLQTPYETRNLLPKLKYEAKSGQYYVEYCEDGKIVEMVGVIGYDEQRKAMKMAFSDQNTELGRSSLQQMNKERYEQTNFWKEHATLLVNIGAIVVIMVFLWLIADKLIDITGAVAQIVTESGKLQESQANIIDSLNRLLNSQGVIQLSN